MTAGLIALTLPAAAGLAGPSEEPFVRVERIVDLNSGDDDDEIVEREAISPDGRYAWYEHRYVFDGTERSSWLERIDLHARESAGAWIVDTDGDLIEDSESIDAAVVDRDGAFVYVVVDGERIVKLAAGTAEPVGMIDSPTSDPLFRGVGSPRSPVAYFMTRNSGEIFRLDLETFTFADESAQVGAGYIWDVATSPEGDRLYVLQQRQVDGEDQLHLVTLAADTLANLGSLEVTRYGAEKTAALAGEPGVRFAHVVVVDDPQVDVYEIDLQAASARQLDVPSELSATDPVRSRTGGPWAVTHPSGEFLVAGRPSSDGSVLYRVALPSMTLTGTTRLLPGEEASGSNRRGEMPFFDETGSHLYVAAGPLDPYESTEPTRLVRVQVADDQGSEDDLQGPADEPYRDAVVRLAGRDRYETAATVALAMFAPEQTTVYLATGEDFPDALVAAPLTGGDAPVLLTRPDTLPDATRTALETLVPDRVVAFGGEAAVSATVLSEAAVAARGAEIDRIGGPDRFGTAVAVARRLPPSDTVYIATGLAFPDALAVGAVTGGAPILLVTPTSLPAVTAEALARLAPKRIVAVGGTAAVSDEVFDAAVAAATGDVERDRVWGQDRYGTAVEIAERVPDGEMAVVVTGEDFPDAAAAAPFAIANAAPILLASRFSLSGPAVAHLEERNRLRCFVLVGGEAALARSLADQVAAIASDC